MAIETYIFTGISCTTGAITILYTFDIPTVLFTNKVFSGTTNDFYTAICEPVLVGSIPQPSVFVVPNTTSYGCPTFKISCVGDCTYANNVGYVTLGNQTWYTKNIDVSTYGNGDIIPQVTDNTQWANLTTGAWCYYNNDPAMGRIYGKLYNYYAIKDPRGLYGQGGNNYWIPSSSDFHVLSNFLGGDLISANALKESGTSHWNSPNNGATNASCFTALPGGYRRPDGTFANIGVIGQFWTYTLTKFGNSYSIYFVNGDSNFYETLSVPNLGFSVRSVNTVY